MASECIGETNFTIDWVVEKIVKDLKLEEPNLKLKSWEAKQIGIGQGFLSKIFRLKLQWEEKNEKLPDSVVLKMPTMATIIESMENMEAIRNASEESRKETIDSLESMVELIIMEHANECQFYSLFNNQGVKTLPHIYFSMGHSQEEQGIIIMEDLSTSAVNGDMAKGLNKGQVMQVLDLLAYVHAESLKNPEYCKKFKPMSKEQVDTPMINMTLAQLKTMKPEYFGGVEEQLLWISDPDYLYQTVNFSHQTIGLPPVLVHGDLWSNNLMFDKDDNDQLKAVIDWQIVHSGNFAEDIARMLVSSCSPQLRRGELESILIHYSDKLAEHLGYRHKDLTLENMLKAYEAMYPYCLLLFMDGLPVFAESPAVQGPEKEAKVEQLMLRAKCALEDVAVYREKLGK